MNLKIDNLVQGNISTLFLFVVIFFILLILLLIKLLTLNRKTKEILHKLDTSENNILDEIKSSVQTKFIETATETEDLMNLAVEVWRIDQRLKKISQGVTENHKKALDTSLQRMKKIFDKYDLEIRDYTGQKYNTGLSAIDVISVERDKKIKEDMIKETVEPMLLLKGQIVKKAKVIVLSKG